VAVARAGRRSRGGYHSESGAGKEAGVCTNRTELQVFNYNLDAAKGRIEMTSSNAFRLIAFLAVLLIAIGAASTGLSAPKPDRKPDLDLGLATNNMKQLAPNVFVAEIAPGLWVHSTVSLIEGNLLYPANGMLLESGDHSILVDTGWEPEQTKVLLEWARGALKHPVTRAIVTHSHSDRTAGVSLLESAQVEVIALSLTGEILRAKHLPVPDHLIAFPTTPLGDADGFELFYPGAGHTRDNLVVFFRREQIVFGGCFIKSANNTVLGNIEDADLAAWPESARRLREQYPDAKFVIPGHGPIAGDTIERTLQLLRENTPKKP
jgi:metallo-beta-lactamase class B